MSAASGYVSYRRRAPRDGGEVYVRSRDGARFTNQHVVEYSPYISLKHECHNNLQIVTGQTAIKYLFK